MLEAVYAQLCRHFVLLVQPFARQTIPGKVQFPKSIYYLSLHPGWGETEGQVQVQVQVQVQAQVQAGERARD